MSILTNHLIEGLTPQMISSVVLEPDEDACTVKLTIPTDIGTLNYEETLSWASDTPSPAVKKAAAEFVALLVKEVQAQRAKKKQIPCATCSSKCCGRHYGTVRVTKTDLIRFRKGGLKVKDTIVLWDKSTERKPAMSMENTVGYMKMQPWTGYSKDANETACKFLTEAGCSIYEHRPQVCRDYSGWDCEIYEEDPAKKSGKVRLRVVR